MSSPFALPLQASPELDPLPQTVEILSGGRRVPLRNTRLTEIAPGEWQLEFHVGAQTDPVAVIEIVRGGGGTLMLSIDGGPVVGAHSRLRPRYQTILSQPVRYSFAWP